MSVHLVDSLIYSGSWGRLNFACCSMMCRARVRG